MMVRLKGIRESRNEGVRNMSRTKEVTQVINPVGEYGAIRTVPTMSVLRQVRPKRSDVEPGKLLLGGASSSENSAGGVNVLSMKRVATSYAKAIASPCLA